MLLVGQSLGFWRGALAGASVRGGSAPVVAAARAQARAGAQALDLNFGIDPSPDEIPWAVAAVREALPETPLWVDAGRARTIAAALEACTRNGLSGPFVANSLAVGATMRTDEAALLRAAAAAGAGVVISPRLLDARGNADAEVAAMMEAAFRAADRARAAGVPPPYYLDALAYPALRDPRRLRRSLALLRLYGARADVTALAAVGNVAFGAPRSMAAPLRAIYAAAATGAGARALILPVEDAGCMRAVRLALGEAAPVDAGEAWLCAVAGATGRDVSPPPAPPEYDEATRALFESEEG